MQHLLPTSEEGQSGDFAGIIVRAGEQRRDLVDGVLRLEEGAGLGGPCRPASAGLVG